MKWKVETRGDVYNRLIKWHKRFAWFPVFFNGERHWLCHFERRLVSSETAYFLLEWEQFQYRTIDTGNKYD